MVDTTIEQNQWFNGEKVHEKYVMLDGPISSTTPLLVARANGPKSKAKQTAILILQGAAGLISCERPPV
jgi:hypothetical protein